MKTNKIRFIVRKYVMATSAKDAIRLEKNVPVLDVWVDEKWELKSGEPVGFVKKKKKCELN
jgi:hypothetical protein